MRGKKIVMLSLQDHTGSGYAIAEAVSLTTNHFVEYIVLLDDISGHNTHKYPYLYKKKSDAEANAWEVPKSALDYAQGILDTADIIHFKGDDIPVDRMFHGLRIPDKPLIITVGGSFFRRGNTITSIPQNPISDYVDLFDIRTAITPDLNYPEFKGRWTPHAFDCINIKNKWKARKIPLIVHSAGLENKKGTEEFKEACKLLESEGLQFNVDIIENETYTETLKRVSKATIFFAEMSGCGWYGMSGVEAMAMGIPTVAYLSEQAIKQGKDTSAINCGNTVESLTNTLRELIKKDLAEISKESFEYAKDTYSYESVGKVWGDIYDNL
jgi:glycosyltransferase involved in cell wall biosynthesis